MKAVLLSLIMAMSLQKAMSLKKAGGMSLLKAFLLMGIFFLGPVEGHPNFPWWNVRFFDGTFYLINHVSQWQEELSMWQVLSLEEAFQQDPEMQIYIMGHSQMGSPSTNYAPIWNSQASQWLLATNPPGPNQQAGQMLDLELLHYRVEEKQRREQNRVINRWSKGEEAKKGCGKSWENDPVYWWAHKKKEPDHGWWEEDWGSSHHSSGSARSSWEPDEAWPPGPSEPSSSTPKWSNERYLARGWGSACRRHQRNQYKQRGEPVPEHLQPRPTTGQMAKYYKRQMMSLVRQCQGLAEEERKSPAEPEEAEPEPAMADDPTSPADWDDSSSSEMTVTAPGHPGPCLGESVGLGLLGGAPLQTLSLGHWSPQDQLSLKRLRPGIHPKSLGRLAPASLRRLSPKTLLSRRRKKRMMMMSQSLKRLSIKKRKKEKEKAQGMERVRMQMTTWMEGLTKGLRKGLEKGLAVGQILHQWLLKQQPEPVKGCLSLLKG